MSTKGLYICSLVGVQKIFMLVFSFISLSVSLFHSFHQIQRLMIVILALQLHNPTPSLYELCAMQRVTRASEAQAEATAPDVHPDNCFFIPYLPSYLLYLMHYVLQFMCNVVLKGMAWPVSGHM